MIDHSNVLDKILSPVTADSFLSGYLEQKPLLIKRQDGDYFKALLTLDDLEYLLSNVGTLGSFDVRLSSTDRLIFDKHYAQVNRVQNMEVKSKVNVHKLFRLYHDHKATIIIDQITNVWPAVMELSKAVNQALQCSSDCNVYITPDQSQGFEAHYDTHDVFILQIAGKKRWKVYSNPTYLPLANQPSIAFDCSSQVPLYDVVLEQGDTLYMPKGFVHEAMTTDGVSAHITLGIYNTTWTRLLLDYVAQLAGDEDLLRTGFFVDELRGIEDLSNKLEIVKERLMRDLTPERLVQLSGRYRSTQPGRFSLRSTSTVQPLS